MNKTELRELQFNWKVAVCLGDRESQMQPCWFRKCIPGIDGCEGPIQGCHWIKRQRVRNSLDLNCVHEIDHDLITLAEWDPRNGVPGCEAHHYRFDSNRMPSLVIPRELVPTTVEMFCTDWGLETQLEDRNPPATQCPECGEPYGVDGGRCFECRGKSML